MPSEATLGRALRLSTEQLVLLRNEDVDGYVEGLPAQEAACTAMAELDVAGLSESERGQLERLVETNAEILEKVNAWLKQEKAQMTKLREARTTFRAYGATVPPAPIRSISA